MTSIKSQQGFGLIVFFLAIIAAGAVFILTNTGPDDGRVVSENNTTASLAKAKVALLSYATTYYLRNAGIHGLLPCPEKSSSFDDGDSAGACGSTHESSIGRLPWRSLHIQPLKDAAGECLWYALSGGFFHSPRSPQTNDDTPGMFQVFNQNGVLHMGLTPEDRVVAVIIAPGLPLPGQTRVAATSSLPCKVPHDVVTASDYLDNHQGINNAAVDETNSDQIEQFINSTALSDNPSLNDRMITITAAEIFDEIKKQTPLYDTKILNLGIELSNCLIDYADASNTVQNPVISGSCVADCNDARKLCLLAATDKNEEKLCRDESKKCKNNCPKGGGKGKGGGTDTYYQFPWPAPLDLGFADFRFNSSYNDIDATAVSTEGYLGRLPFDISNSNAITGISIINDNTLLDFCSISLSSESGRLWQYWKDHWFYVLGKDFEPVGSTKANVACTNCPVYQGSLNDYAAILIFSSEIIPGQLRRSNETENPDPVIGDSKYSIANYLEGSNSSNYPDTNGDKTYATYSVTDTPNDMLFCINSDMSYVSGVCP